MLAVGWMYYVRARKIVGAYGRHYARARRAFERDGNTVQRVVTSLSDVGVRVLRPTSAGDLLELPSDHVQRVKTVSDSVKLHLSYSRNCVFVPPLPNNPSVPELTEEIPAIRSGDVLMVQLKHPLDVPGLEELCAPILDEIERKIFGSYVVVDKLYVYRSPVSRQMPLGSWLWHYDNHPHEILKVMVYLTDVTSQSGPFEYLRSASSLTPLDGSPVTPLYGSSRIPEDVIERHLTAGYESHEVTGPMGTTIVFDNNVVHRANVARMAYRDVIVLQVRPASVKLRPYVTPARTGSFQHAPFSPNPEVVEPFVRRLRHYS
jgi:hypothetical protein